MTNTKLLILTILIFALSCTKRNKLEYESSQSKVAFPLILDTSNFSTEHCELSWLSEANFQPLYIGNPKDTVRINYWFSYMRPSDDLVDTFEQETKYPMKPYYRPWMFHKNYRDPDTNEIEIRIDTTQRISAYSRQYNTHNNFVKAYLVQLKNISNDTLAIGNQHFLSMITECLDSTNTWTPIEKKLIYRCGVGITTIILPPREIVLTNLPVFEGNYETKYRIVFGENISNEILCKINYNQFVNRFYENGNYKDDYLK